MVMFLPRHLQHGHYYSDHVKVNLKITRLQSTQISRKLFLHCNSKARRTTTPLFLTSCVISRKDTFRICLDDSFKGKHDAKSKPAMVIGNIERGGAPQKAQGE